MKFDIKGTLEPVSLGGSNCPKLYDFLNHIQGSYCFQPVLINNLLELKNGKENQSLHQTIRIQIFSKFPKDDLLSSLTN